MALKLGPSFMVVVHNTLVYYYYIGCTKVCRSSIGEMYHGSKQLYCWKYDTIYNKVILKQTCSKHYYRILECNAILSLILLSIICNKKEVSWSTVQVFLSTQLWLKLKSRVNALYSTAFNPKVKKERNRLERRNFFSVALMSLNKSWGQLDLHFYSTLIKPKNTKYYAFFEFLSRYSFMALPFFIGQIGYWKKGL